MLRTPLFCWFYIFFFFFRFRVHKYPEQIPKIDFDYYKSRLVNKAMVAEFEKAVRLL
jgi:hypothetical protein